MRDEGRGKNEM